MKRFLLLLLILVTCAAVHGQLPQFSYTSFEDWVYSNPATELNSDNILANKIYLYKTSAGMPLTLTSPLFTCRGGSVLDMNVTWITDQWMNEGFVVSKVGLTATILDAQGNPVDSVTFTPTSVSRTNRLNLAIAVPRGMTQMKLRFASWKADVKSNGAVRQIAMTSMLRGDIDHDGAITISDINRMIDIILSGGQFDGPLVLADLNDDRSVTIADINLLIDMILS